VVDRLGRHLADQEFEATCPGYRKPLAWLPAQGTVTAVGVDERPRRDRRTRRREGTGAYGAELARILRQAGLKVVEVDRPDRLTEAA
jgi:hypothetical protein